VAIRENEQRARFVGYSTNRYKLVAFTASAGLTGLAGVLLLFNNRMTSASRFRWRSPASCWRW
jgi:ABC-type branched-subunit amino acid transport system permease subunit